jgi:hypothetical integral membrane protein (TIGR02206 family)
MTPSSSPPRVPCRTLLFGGPPAPKPGFRILGPSHLVTAAFFVVLNVLLVVFRAGIRGTPLDAALRVLMASLLLANELGLSAWRIRHGVWDVRTSLPLHLCGVSVVLAAAMLYADSYVIFELTYFWAMGGALQGLLTPDVEGFDAPHFRFATTFVSHGLIVTANLYMVFVGSMRPTFSSYLKSMAVLNAWGAAMLLFNRATGSNYGFLCRKPDSPTLFDVLGPWPWYLASLEAIAWALSFLFLLPFLVGA